MQRQQIVLTPEMLYNQRQFRHKEDSLPCKTLSVEGAGASVTVAYLSISSQSHAPDCTSHILADVSFQRRVNKAGETQFEFGF